MKRLSPILRTAALLLCAAVCLFAFVPGAQAANSVPTIDVSVQLATDGSARITQVWTGSFHEGTEVYLPVENLGTMTVSDLAVSSSLGAYTTLPEWNVDASFDEKAYKCGIAETSRGVELCFGISEYGENTYTFSYTVTGLVGAYNDTDGFLFQFVNPGMSIFPSDVTVRIQPPAGMTISDGNAGIWAFGFQGDIQFADGGVLAKSTEALDGNASCIIMLELNKGVLSPVRAVDGDFADVKTRAFEGSDYGTGEDESMGLFGYLFAAVFVGVIALAITLVVRKAIQRAKVLKFEREANYYRDVPNGGRLPVSYALSDNFRINKENGSLIGAALLRMMEQGNIMPCKRTEDGVFGREKEIVDLRLEHAPDANDSLLYNLFGQLQKATGDDGVTVSQKSLKKTVKRNYEEFNAIIDNAKLSGEQTLATEGCLVKGATDCLDGLTDAGREQLAQLMGFKKYLMEFSLIAERSSCDVVLWKEYLVYAVLLDIADKAISELKKAYPDQIDQVSMLENDFLSYYVFSSLVSDSFHSAQVARSSGSGGASSFGGGGGFSGGGFGGGTR